MKVTNNIIKELLKSDDPELWHLACLVLDTSEHSDMLRYCRYASVVHYDAYIFLINYIHIYNYDYDRI